MNIVADTSAFLAVVLCEPERNALMSAVEGHDLLAPEVLPFEVGNALTALSRRQRLSRDEVLAAWEIVGNIPVALRKVDIRAAVETAVKFQIYAYDAYFLECAATYRAPLVTLDKGMRQIARRLSIEVVELDT